MPKRTPESESVINFLLDKVKKKNSIFLKILDFKRLCTTLIYHLQYMAGARRRLTVLSPSRIVEDI